MGRADVGSVGTPSAGNNGDVQFNYNKRFGAHIGEFTYSTATFTLSVPIINVDTITINGNTYYWPGEPGGGSTCLRNDGAGTLTWETCSGGGGGGGGANIAFQDGGITISSPTEIGNFNGTHFIITSPVSGTALVTLNPSTVTLLGSSIDLASEVTGSLPAASIAAGSLGASVIASSHAVGSVLDSAIVSLTGSKVTGNIPGNAAGITGTVNVSQVLGAVSVYAATATAQFPFGLTVSSITSQNIANTYGITTSSIVASTITISGRIVFPDGTVITSTSPFGSGSGGGDSFGSHTATKTITANYGITTTTITVSSITVSGKITFPDSTIMISTTQFLSSSSTSTVRFIESDGSTILAAVSTINIDTSTLVGAAVGSSTVTLRVNPDLEVSTLTFTSFPANTPLYVDVYGDIQGRAVRLPDDIIGTLPQEYGGTGYENYTDGQILVGQTATGRLQRTYLTAGSNVTISTGSGSITIAASGGSGGGGDSLGSHQSTMTLTANYGIVSTTITVTDDAYAAGWDGSALVPTKNAIYDKIEALGSGADGTGYAVEPATVPFNLAKGVTISSGITIGGSSAIGSTTTLTSTMSLVYVTVPANTAWVTLTLPDATASEGRNIMIYKVDATTGAVRIVPAGADTIQGSTDIRLNAKFQHAHVQSLGAPGWGEGIGGIQTTPLYIGFNGDGGNANTRVSSTTYACPMLVEVPVTVVGFAWYVQTAAAGSYATLSIYDGKLNLVTSTGPVLVGSFGNNSTTITPTHLPPGQYYYGWQQAVATVAISDDPGAGNGGNGNIYCSTNADTDLVPPNPFVLGTGAAKAGPAINIRISGGRTGL